MVHQHFMLVEPFTVLENLLLGAEGGVTLAGGAARARAEIAALEREYGLDVDLDATVGDLPVGVQQRVEILKALFRGARVLILDEPTGVLTPQEADHLFRILRNLRDQGRTVVLITHKLREIMAVTDNVSVMRQGAMVAHRPTAETSTEELAELMVGRKVLLRVEKGAARAGRAGARGRAPRGQGRQRRHPGQGRQLHGARRRDRRHRGRRRQRPVRAARGAGRHPADRRRRDPDQGPAARRRRPRRAPRASATCPRTGCAWAWCATSRPTRTRSSATTSTPSTAATGCSRPAASSAPACAGCGATTCGRATPQLKAGSFSGGNQQKLVLAREMEHDPDLLLVGQPTRGVDIGAIEFIHKRLIEMRDRGKAVLLVSVELDEIRSLADRILVMFDGTITGELEGEDADERRIGLLMAGVTEAQAA